MDDLKLNIMLTVFIYNSKTTGNALFGEQGMVQYSSTCLPPMWSGFQSCRQQHMWVAFVVGSLLCSIHRTPGYITLPLAFLPVSSQWSLQSIFIHVASIYWNKKKHLCKKRVHLPQDLFGTLTWPPFHCFGAPIWPLWHHVKMLNLQKLFT